MALKIKKQIKNPDGTFTELEGTEAEIEAYEKKQRKKNESVQKKREILTDEIRRMVQDEVAKIPPTIVNIPYPVYPPEPLPWRTTGPFAPRWPEPLPYITWTSNEIINSGGSLTCERPDDDVVTAYAVTQ